MSLWGRLEFGDCVVAVAAATTAFARHDEAALSLLAARDL